MTSAPAIGFEYRSTRWVFVALASVAMLGGIAALVSGVSAYTKCVLVIADALFWTHSTRRQRTSISAVGWSPASGWSLRADDGMDDAATLLSHRVIGTFVLLRLASPRQGKLALWLGPDNSDADTRRRLRMRLALLGADPAEAGT